ncbi:MAG: single-stranded-DNA-specific exonuclease RecJ [Clostridia bacterium]|nr:single-stranded-DNA-specific exonuclease RecJ [Clostridia bacterium]
MERITLDENQIRTAKNLGISQDFLRLLLMRRKEKKDIPSFLKPSLDDMCSPFSIDGMRQAVDRVKVAIEKKQKVLIFGDYDCDGIGAVSILVMFLRDKLDVTYFVPDRNKDGYGMSVDALSRQVKRKRPDLVITVDCGITAVDEVAYLKSEGIDAIVTDHHEPQSILPDCIIVDPKVKKEGFYDFCGAGVALKLVEGIAGREEMKKYLDIAAISTIADVVPLKKDNRIIAYYGLQKLNKEPRKFIKYLLDTDRLTSQDIMFRLAPRLNAAGRLNTATKSVELLLEDDPSVIRSIAESLNNDNAKRQEICEKVVREGKTMLKGIDFNTTRIIVLSSTDWEAGVLGIAAARLSEEFKCPAILFNEKDGVLKGSARSVKAVNIFELLTKLSDYFETFGGHAQAAGVTITKDKFDAFKKAIEKEVLENYSADEFLPQNDCDMLLDGEQDLLPFAKELEKLEPTGYGNPKPVFMLKGENFKFNRIGITKHVKCSLSSGLELVGFSKFDYCLGFTSGKVEICFTLGVNEYQNRLYPQGVISSLNATEIAIDEEESMITCVHQLENEGETTVESIDKNGILKLLEKPFGTCIVCFSQEEYENIKAQIPAVDGLPVNVATSKCLNPENCVVLTPAEVFDFSFFTNVVIAGKAFSSGYIKKIEEQAVNTFAFGDISINKIKISERLFREVYPEIRAMAMKNMRLTSFAKFYQQISAKVKITPFELSVICRTFASLRLIETTDRGIINITGVKSDLMKSPIYRNLIHD